MDNDGKLKPVYVGYKTVMPAEGNAMGLVKSMVAALEPMVPAEEQKKRVQSGAGDGAYVRMGIGRALCEFLGGDPCWRVFIWDVAHLLELAVKDAREDRIGIIVLVSVKWYSEALNELKEVLGHFQNGKGLLEVKALGEAEGVEKFLTPLLPECGTRFILEESHSWTNYLNNYPAFVASFKEKATIPEGARTRSGDPRMERNDSEKAAQGAYELMSTVVHVGRALILRDLTRWLANFSVYAQKVNVVPWELQEALMALIARLKRMSSDAAEGAVGFFVLFYYFVSF